MHNEEFNLSDISSSLLAADDHHKLTAESVPALCNSIFNWKITETETVLRGKETAVIFHREDHMDMNKANW